MKTPSMHCRRGLCPWAAPGSTPRTARSSIQSDAPVATVSYADLNITAPAGRHALEGRVARAAAKACASRTSGNRSVEVALAQRHCLSFAMARARIDIDLAVARAGTQLASARTITVAVP